MGEAQGAIPAFLTKAVDFPDGTSYELLQPLTDFRQCHDGTPAEARVVFTCRQSGPGSQEEFIMKIKVQIKGDDLRPSQEPESGPSTTTSAELKALEKFRGASCLFAPHLVNFMRATQGPDGLFPGGYLTFTLMTKLPGESLLNLQFWGMPVEDREEISKEFLVALQSIFAVGVEPEDRGLRNVMWERDSKKCSIVDFELWHETADSIAEEKVELQKWGLASRPPPRSWWDAWNQGR